MFPVAGHVRPHMVGGVFGRAAIIRLSKACGAGRSAADRGGIGTGAAVLACMSHGPGWYGASRRRRYFGIRFVAAATDESGKTVNYESI